MPTFDNSAAIRQTMLEDPGFVGATLGSQVVELTPERVVLQLDAGRELQQHFGGPHAAIIFGLGESAAYCLLMRVFGDLVVDRTAPLVKSGEIGYTAIALGTLLATATSSTDEDAARATFAERGSLTYVVDVAFATADGASTGTATYRMGLKTF